MADHALCRVGVTLVQQNDNWQVNLGPRYPFAGLQELLPAGEDVPTPRVEPRRRVEPGVAQPGEPGRPREQTFDVTIGLDSHGPVGLAQQEGEEDLVGRVAWIGIPAPFQVSEPTTIRTIFATMRRLRFECLAHAVRHDNDSTSRPAMTGCRPE